MTTKASHVMLAALALAGLSCNSLTSVDAPDILQPSQLNTPDGATRVYSPWATA